MMSNERRNSSRIHLEIGVTVLENSGNRSLRAIDISERGMFIKTDDPAPVRRLIRLRVPVASDGQELHVLALVVHRVLPTPGTLTMDSPPGMGIQLYGLGPLARKRWTEWVKNLTIDCATPNGEPPPVPLQRVDNPPPIDSIKRMSVRHSTSWDVKIIGDSGENTRTTNISAGGAFILTTQPHTEGDTLDLILVHPKTAEGFDISCQIVRNVAKPNRGIGVRFVDMTDERSRELLEFIESAVAQIDDELVILEQDDPMLA